MGTPLNGPKVVLIGDIGWSGLYHLGDEAMTEAAIDMLRDRNITDITLIAAEPEVSTEMYGLPSVTRLGFRKQWSRERMEARLAEITSALQRSDMSRSEVFDAVAASDAVVIAGGGNINSTHVHHLFERVALVRIARHLDKPVFVTSQTLGPELRPTDAALVREIIEYATCFGARESTTLRLAMTLGGDADRVVRTMDDAMMLTPGEADRDAVAEMGLPERYIIGTFSAHNRTTNLSADDYNGRLAKTLEQMSDQFDADVILVPHLGSFDPSVATHDLVSHQKILDATDNGRIAALGLLPARQVTALTEGAILSVSTRYHPAVFAPSLGTPAVTITTNYYSAVRMRGALDNVGMGRYAMPVDAWVHGPFDDVVGDLVARSSEATEHITTVARQRFAEQSAWWDALTDTIKGKPWARPGDISAVQEFPMPAAWTELLTVQNRLSDQLGKAQFRNVLRKQEIRARDLELKQAKEELARQHLNTPKGNTASPRGRSSAPAQRLKKKFQR